MESFSFGLLADPQYASKPSRGNRHYPHALAKVQHCMDFFRASGVDFAICLGDVVDGHGQAADQRLARQDCQAMQAAFDSLGRPCYHTLGNHDVYSLSRDWLAGLWGLPRAEGYYAFEHKGAQFLFLDTNQDAAGMPYLPGQGRWDESYVDAAQVEWLQAQLAQSEAPRCVVCTHALLDGAEMRHTVKNADAVRRVLEQSGRAPLVFQGHYHQGYESRIAGIPYYTLPGMVEGAEGYVCWKVTLEGDETRIERVSNSLTGV